MNFDWHHKMLGVPESHPMICPNCGVEMSLRGWIFISDCSGICLSCERDYNRCLDTEDKDY